MKFWTVLAFGEGFIRAGRLAKVELYGVVAASDSNAAFLKAVDLASQRCPELIRSDSASGSKGVLNAEEVNEVTFAEGMQVDVLRVIWGDE